MDVITDRLRQQGRATRPDPTPNKLDNQVH
jgi:hypothetical protein